MYCCHHRKICNFWTRNPHFHSSLGPTNCVAGSGWGKTGLGATLKATDKSTTPRQPGSLFFCFHLRCYCYLFIYLQSSLYSALSSLWVLLINYEHNWLCDSEKDSVTGRLLSLPWRALCPRARISITHSGSSTPQWQTDATDYLNLNYFITTIECNKT